MNTDRKDRLEVRFKPILSREDRATIDRYLESATLFWNCCVFHLESRAEIFITEPISDDSWLRFIKDVQSFFMELKLAYLQPEKKSPIDKDWLKYLPKIFELDDEILGNRLNDYVVSCRSSKRNGGTAGIPRRKTDKSAESIRFNPAHYVIEGRDIVIRQPTPMKIQIPIDITLDLKEGVSYTVAVRRRKVYSSADRFGPDASSANPLYAVTILERSKNSMFRPQT